MRTLSLLELMKKLDIVALFTVPSNASYFRGMIDLHPEGFDLKDNSTPEQSEAFQQHLERINTHCVELGLNSSVASCRRLLALEALEGNPAAVPFKQRAAIWNELRGRLTDELELSLLLFVEPSKVRFFVEPNLFDTADVKVSARFPHAIRDIEEAGKCLALDRSTAVVFHVMRVLEIGLQEFGTKLGVSVVQDKSWQTILNNVNGAIKCLPQSTREEKEHLGKCAAIAAHLQNVKDAWRNDVMHPLESYTPDEALDIWNHSKALMVKLASFV